MNQIEKQLSESGWVKTGECPLLLGVDFSKLIESKRVDDKGKEQKYLSVALYHKGDRYILSWSKWDQMVSERTPLEDKKGHHSNGSTHFNPHTDAVAAGFSHVVTVNVEECTVRFWQEEAKSEPELEAA